MINRRSHPRARVAASAVICTAERYIGTYLVENLSAGGMLLVGEPKIDSGERVRILIHLASGRQVVVEGELCRRERRARNTMSAVRFHRVSTDARLEIQSFVQGKPEREMKAPAW